MPDPTARDTENAAKRQAIAARQQEEWNRVYLLALGKFGPGWEPSGRHFLLDKQHEDECRRTGARPVAAATCYTVSSAEGEKRHFTVDADGRVTEHAGHEEAFRPMLMEPHPTMRIEIRGEMVAPHGYSLCWAPLEMYRPMTAEQLAASRERRERKKAERVEKKWAEANPLLAWAERQDEGEEKGQGR